MPRAINFFIIRKQMDRIRDQTAGLPLSAQRVRHEPAGNGSSTLSRRRLTNHELNRIPIGSIDGQQHGGDIASIVANEQKLYMSKAKILPLPILDEQRHKDLLQTPNGMADVRESRQRRASVDADIQSFLKETEKIAAPSAPDDLCAQLEAEFQQ